MYNAEDFFFDSLLIRTDNHAVDVYKRVRCLIACFLVNFLFLVDDENQLLTFQAPTFTVFGQCLSEEGSMVLNIKL